MKLAVAAVVASTVGLAACQASGPKSAQSSTMPPLDSPHVRIWVSKSGRVDVDGKPIEPSALGPVLAALAQRRGIVLYGREAAEEEPHPNAMHVIQMIVDHRLPTRMSTRPDFSDAVGPDGRIAK